MLVISEFVYLGTLKYTKEALLEVIKQILQAIKFIGIT